MDMGMVAIALVTLRGDFYLGERIPGGPQRVLNGVRGLIDVAQGGEAMSAEIPFGGLEFAMRLAQFVQGVVQMDVLGPLSGSRCRQSERGETHDPEKHDMTNHSKL